MPGMAQELIFKVKTYTIGRHARTLILSVVLAAEALQLNWPLESVVYRPRPISREFGSVVTSDSGAVVSPGARSVKAESADRI